jgi:hypothetical protein
VKEQFAALGTVTGALGALAAALFTSLCCAGPAVFAVLGAGGVTASALLARSRPYLLTAALVFLGIG